MYWSTSASGFGNTNGLMLPDDTDLVEGNFYQNYYAGGPAYTNTGVAWVDDTWYVCSLKFDAKYKLSIWRKSTKAFVVADDDEDYDAQTITHMGVGWNGGSGAPGNVSYDAVNDWIDAKPTRTPGWVYFYIDNFRVGTYCDPEPAHTSWGLAETFQDLPAQFEVGQGSAELLGEFDVSQGSAEFLGRFEVGQDSTELLGKFEAQTTAELLGRFEVGQDSADLLGKAVIRHPDTAELLGKFDVSQGSADLLGEFEAQSTADLLGKGIVKNISSADLPGELVVRHAGSEDLPAAFDGQVSLNLLGEFVVRHSGPVPWLAGWGYRKTHTLTGSTAGSLTNYQVGVKVYYGAGADGTEVIGGVTFGKVYCNSKCKTDFSDIRFTNWDGTTLLDYWLQEKIDSDYAIFWVEVDSIPASPSTVDIYVYYGNASATYVDAQQHGKDTFIAFDDFPGVALDGQWTTDANISVTVAGGTLTCKATAGSWSTWHGIHMAVANVQGIRLESYAINWGHVASDLFQFGSELGVNWANQVLGHRLSDSRAAASECHLTYVHDDSGLSKGNIEGQQPLTSLIEQRDQNGIVKFYKDGVEQSVGGETSSDSFDTLMILVNRFTTYQSPNLYLDRILARNYVDPEPAHTAWGPETEPVLLAEFIVRKSGSAELLGKADINPTIQSGSADLLGKFEAQAIADLLARFEAQATAELLGRAEIQQSDFANLLGKFETQDTADLLAKFEAQAIADLFARFEAQATADLLGKVDITHSTDLLGKFEAQSTAELLGKVDITHSVDLLGKADITHSVDLLGKFEAQATADLLGKVDITHSTDLLGKFEAQATAELLGKADITHSVDLLGKADITHSVDLLGKADITHSVDLLGKVGITHSVELLSHFEVGQDYIDLIARFEVGQDAEELPGRGVIRHSASSDLKFSLYVSPWYLTAVEMLIGGRDRRMDLGGLDREMVIGGRKRRMKIK